MIVFNTFQQQGANIESYELNSLMPEFLEKLPFQLYVTLGIYLNCISDDAGG